MKNRHVIIVMTSWGEEGFDKEKILEGSDLLFPDLVVIIRLFIFKSHMFYACLCTYDIFHNKKCWEREGRPRLNTFQQSTHIPYSFKRMDTGWEKDGTEFSVITY